MRPLPPQSRYPYLEVESTPRFGAGISDAGYQDMIGLAIKECMSFREHNTVGAGAWIFSPMGSTPSVGSGSLRKWIPLTVRVRFCWPMSRSREERLSRFRTLWRIRGKHQGDHGGQRSGVQQPGKPVENAYIENFNGKLREECLNLHWFHSIEEAQEKIEARRDNVHRPHSALNESKVGGTLNLTLTPSFGPSGRL